MRTHKFLIMLGLLALTSCGPTAQYSEITSNQEFQDGFYAQPTTNRKVAKKVEYASQRTRQELIEETKGTEILIEDNNTKRQDTIFVPKNKSTRIAFNKPSQNGTNVTITDIPNNDYYLYGGVDDNLNINIYNVYDRDYYRYGRRPYRYGSYYDPYYDYYGGSFGLGFSWGFGGVGFYSYWDDPWYYDSWYYDP